MLRHCTFCFSGTLTILLNYIIACCIFPDFIKYILQGYGIEIVIYYVIQTLPYIKCGAALHTAALVRRLLQAGNGSKAALGYAKNFAYGVFVRLFCQTVTSLNTAVCLQNITAVEHGNDLFEIFF